MTLETSDFEKIQAMVDRAIERIEKRIDLKADAKETNERFASTIERRVRIQADVDKIVAYLSTQDDKYRNIMADNHKEEIALIKEANKQIDELKAIVASSQLSEEQRRNTEKNATIRYIVTVIVGIIIGVLIPVVLKLMGV